MFVKSIFTNNVSVIASRRFGNSIFLLRIKVDGKQSKFITLKKKNIVYDPNKNAEMISTVFTCNRYPIRKDPLEPMQCTQ